MSSCSDIMHLGRCRPITPSARLHRMESMRDPDRSRAGFAGVPCRARLWRQDDLAELLALGEPLLSRGAVLERNHLVDDRLEPAREELAHDVVELLAVGHRG